MTFSSVNLLWQKRYRGVLPLVANSLSDDGTALVVRPDELESRTYQVLELAASGLAREVAALSVETVRKFEVAPATPVMLGVTVDDIYLFREGRKSRFLADRRVTYSDVSLARQGTMLACAFSDMMFASHTVALGDTTGRVGWTRDMAAPVNRVALAADGRTLVVGGADGGVIALDQMRAVAWEYFQPEPVTGLALGAAGAPCAAGTEPGTVLLLDRTGDVAWRSSLGLPVVAIAMDAAGGTVAVVAGDGASGLLACFGADGAPVFEHELEVTPTGVAVSPNGRFLGVSLADGRLLLFEADFESAAAPAGAREQGLAAAAELSRAGDLAGARGRLLELLAAQPGCLAAGEQLALVEERLVAEALSAAAARQAAGEPGEALALVEGTRQLLPYDGRLFAEVVSLRQAVVARFRAEAALAAEDAARAMTLLGELLRLEPRDQEAREALVALQAPLAARLVEEGEACAARGDQAGARERWGRARALHDSPELEARVRRLEVERSVAAGIRLYEQQRFAEASFQFKKALALDPHHDAARRYLQYTDGGGPDSQIAGRFHRLE